LQSAWSTLQASGSASRTVAAAMGRRTIGRPANSITWSISRSISGDVFSGR
jgi:hypothetical protein